MTFKPGQHVIVTFGDRQRGGTVSYTYADGQTVGVVYDGQTHSNVLPSRIVRPKPADDGITIIATGPVREMLALKDADDANHISVAERRERIRAKRGFISADGIVICGACFDDDRFGAAGNITKIARFEDDAWEPFNPEPGDDFCSRCDRDITGRHPNV